MLRTLPQLSSGQGFSNLTGKFFLHCFAAVVSGPFPLNLHHAGSRDPRLLRRFAVLLFLLGALACDSFAQSGALQPATPNPEVAAAAEVPLPPAPSAHLTLVRMTVQVSAAPIGFSIANPSPAPLHATVEDIQPSAGTFGDFARYLQVFPGVVSNGDWSDDVIVRGGNPMENLFLVDGIEVPNLNQITVQESTGGLFSMVDAPAIQNVDFYTGGFDASYDERLSSVVEIHTRSSQDQERRGQINLGYIGNGGLLDAPLGHSGSIMGSAHRSILNLVTNDIGLGGTPVYSNALLRGQIDSSPVDEINFLSLSGWDSIAITPGGAGHNDLWQTDFINEQYAGWRTTNGVRWRHVYSPRLLGIATASDFEQQTDIQQQNQPEGDLNAECQVTENLPPISVYSQLNHDGRANLKYDVIFDNDRDWSLLAGVSGTLDRVDYRVAQPVGEQSPLSMNPAATDADSFAPNFLTGESGSYAQATWRAGTRWSVSGGGRLQTFAEGGHWTLTPRLNSALRISRHTGLHAAFGEYAQMPPSAWLTAWPQNERLLPIRVRHLVAGADLYDGPHARIGIEAYDKAYRDYPVSTQYPSLSLANMVDDFEGQVLWIPLASEGTGRARGVELSTAANLGTHLSGQVNVAYAHTNYAGLDRVLRPGNFDYPLVGNTSGTWHSGRRYEASWRYAYTSGHPYTPFLLALSKEQNRPVYDLARINALRGPVYSRMDFEADRSFYFGSRHLTAYFGFDNAWNRKNFLAYQWMPNVGAISSCNRPSACESELYDLSRFPDGGLRLEF